MASTQSCGQLTTLLFMFQVAARKQGDAVASPLHGAEESQDRHPAEVRYFLEVSYFLEMQPHAQLK